MNTKFFNLFVLMAGMLLLFTRCSKDDIEEKDPFSEATNPDIVKTIKLTIDIRNSIEIVEFGLSSDSDDYEEFATEAKTFPMELSIDWGDGSITNSNSHQYSVEGKYNVIIKAKNLRCFSYSRFYNNLIATDFKECKSLVEIKLNKQEGLFTLDVSGLSQLKLLDIACNNNLRSLSLDGCISLMYLDCYSNNLKTLNIEPCKQLKELACGVNSLETLNIEPCKQLESLDCSDNILTSLALSGNNMLSDIDLSDNRLGNAALNTIYNSLPDRPKTEQGVINISSNSGVGNTSIAEKKNWNVYK